MNAAQLQLGSAPTSRVCADRVGGVAGLSADDRRKRRDSAVNTSGGLSKGARVVFDHLNGHPLAPKAIAKEAGFFTVAVHRHLEQLADAGLVVEDGEGWRRA